MRHFHSAREKMKRPKHVRNLCGSGMLTIAGLTFAASSLGQPDTSQRPQCQSGAFQCVHHVIQEMDKRYKRLSRDCDHDAIFALVYLRTTEKYQETALDLGFQDVSSVTREDALFADYYFRAYDAYHGGEGGVPLAWQIAFDAATAQTLTVAGNAFLGINAHIQRDLAFTLYDLHLRGQAVSKHDHDLVNTFLAQVDVATEMMERYDPGYPTGGDPTLIPAWREQAWQNFVALRDAPTPEARASVAAAIEGIAAAYAQQFTQIFALPNGDSTARNAYCAAQ